MTAPTPADHAEVVVVGAGAAGLLAAIHAARAGARTLLLEGSGRIGSKILISGGGRCNVLPGQFDLDAFHTSGSRNVLRRLFRTWPLEQVIAFFEEDLGVPLVLEQESGKLFPKAQKARVVREALLKAVRRDGVEVHINWRLHAVERNGTGFTLRSDQDQSLSCSRLILATGGRSVPKTGSDGHGYALATALGHTVLPTYPALVPLTTEDPQWLALSGLSGPVKWRALRANKVMEQGTGALLCTHTGWSGPAILDASHWWLRDRAAIRVAWLGWNRQQWQRHLANHARQQISAAVAEVLPRRLAEALVTMAGLPLDQSRAQLRREDRDRLLDHLSDLELPIQGSRGFAVAEVTGGGVPLEEVNPSTLESRACPGLWLCGEILDVIGRIGGHNFLWAWVTGRLAGAAAAGQRA